MRLFTKIFISSLAVLSAAMAVTGGMLIKESFDNSLSREKGVALSEYGHIAYTLQTGMQSISESGELTRENLTILARQAADVSPCGVALFDAEGEMLYSTLPDMRIAEGKNNDSDIAAMYSIFVTDTGRYIKVTSGLTVNDVSVAFVISKNIDSIYQESEAFARKYILIYSVSVFAAAAALAVLSYFIARPIRRLTVSAARIAEGKYDERCPVFSRDETGELALGFNRMAETVEESISELKRSAQQKEDFMASFAHEIKTPLTSVIGYADMLYQGRLRDEEAANAAGFILSEGMRLEALSLKLMELIVLEKTKFSLISLPAIDVFDDIGKALTHEIEGSHVNIGVDVAKKYKEPEAVIHAIEAHHNDVEPRTAVAWIVQAADAISAARPGSRENVENYIKRLEKLEEIANSFPGVDNCFAIQAGREIRILVKPEIVDDDQMVILAREVAEKIEAELDYPGQIKVHLVRESRAVDYAK